MLFYRPLAAVDSNPMTLSGNLSIFGGNLTTFSGLAVIPYVVALRLEVRRTNDPLRLRRSLAITQGQALTLGSHLMT
jgi:hypothetical protein